MLQDWPQQKERLEELIGEAVRRRMRATAPVSNAVSQFFIPEGHRSVFIEPDGSTLELELRPHEARVQFSRDEMLSGGVDVVEKVVTELGEGLGKELDLGIIRRLKEIPPEMGGKISGSTTEELAEKFLEVLKEMTVDFDYDGNPTTSFVIHPDTYPQLKAIEDDPAIKRRVDELMAEKKREWINRESRRRLAD